MHSNAMVLVVRLLGLEQRLPLLQVSHGVGWQGMCVCTCVFVCVYVCVCVCV